MRRLIPGIFFSRRNKKTTYIITLPQMEAQEDELIEISRMVMDVAQRILNEKNTAIYDENLNVEWLDDYR